MLDMEYIIDKFSFLIFLTKILPHDTKFSLTYRYMLSWESHNGQCKILACGENGSSLKCNLNEAEAVCHHWELILDQYVWKVRVFK